MDQKSRDKLARFAEDYGMKGKTIEDQLKGLGGNFPVQSQNATEQRPISFDYGQIEARVMSFDEHEAKLVTNLALKGLEDEKIHRRN